MVLITNSELIHAIEIIKILLRYPSTQIKNNFKIQLSMNDRTTLVFFKLQRQSMNHWQ